MRGSSWSAVTRDGLSRPAVSASAAVMARETSVGRVAWYAADKTALSRRPPVAASAARASSRSRFFSSSCPPRVAHLRIVWIRWFCWSGLDRYSSICAWMHFSRSPIMACAVRAMMGVRWLPRLRSYSRIFAVASKPPYFLSAKTKTSKKVAFQLTIMGICTSIRMTSNFFLLTASTASSPFPTTVTTWWYFSKILTASR